MADSSSFWSDWVNGITTVSKAQPAATFTDRFGGTVAQAPQQDRSYPKHPMDPNDPDYNPKWDPHNAQYDPNDPRLIGGPYTGPRSPQGIVAEAPTRPASQQPTIPIQTAQGAPQGPTQQLQTAPNSGMIGASPYANQALTGGSGMPIGGLPTQNPFPDYSSPQQVQPQQMQLEQLRMANLPRIQQFQQLMARLRQQVPTLGLS